ncbi:MAG: hypothetical protein EA352_12020, partial [Gemmatimonadales bacterium]
AVLALEAPEFHYRVDLEERAELGDVRRRWILFGRRHQRTNFARSHMEVELRLASGEVVGRWAASGPWTLTSEEELSGAHGSDRVRDRDVLVEDPARHFVETRYPALAEEPLEWSSMPVASELVQRLERDIETELRQNETAALSRVFASVCRPDAPSVREGLAPADLQSVRRVGDALDRMTLARALLAAFVRLGLPDALEDEPALATLLHGMEGLPHRQSLCASVDAGESPLRRVWLEEVPRVRTVEAARGLDRALAAAEARRGAGLSTGMVEATLEQLRATLRLQRARIAAAQANP